MKLFQTLEQADEQLLRLKNRLAALSLQCDDIVDEVEAILRDWPELFRQPYSFIVRQGWDH
jgi:hypothetical protein